MKKIGREVKGVNFRIIAWEKLRTRADNLARERGANEGEIPKYVMEASEFFEEHRRQELLQKLKEPN
jgi:hypothetical protein